MRRKYLGRFIFRVAVFLAVGALAVLEPEAFAVMEPGGFFSRFSLLHILWVIWIGDMVLKLFPVPGTLALGAAKQLGPFYVPAKSPPGKEEIRAYFADQNRRALQVFGAWTVLGAAIAFLWGQGFLGNQGLLLIAVFFYVYDLFCVLFWCPFRSWFLKNRCCTTCRIFNWDHLMMVTPLVCINSFYCRSLVVGAVFVLAVWEYRVFHDSERFFEGTNEALKCKNCTDLLCGKRMGSRVGKENRRKTDEGSGEFFRQ
ncbi:MAG: hypothetical protein HFI31_16485 [Lachnospiraceae bacterium]|nr:hypothetical protein [Lachnospiraceae bacterium]